MQPVLGLAAVSKGDRGSDTCPGELRWPLTSSVGFCPPRHHGCILAPAKARAGSVPGAEKPSWDLRFHRCRFLNP